MSLLSNISTNTKLVFTIIVGIGSIVGSVWAIDDRYVDQKEIVVTLQQYNAEIQQRISNLEKAGMFRDYNYLTERYYQLKRKLNNNPEDLELREEFNFVKTKRVAIAEELGI